ncbi:MAG: hypothetical protein FWG20_04840 [Candidatus Cloacimonetes bacterium]|nr:hypothetical protein [Candidatus Cloacimonadota bacterium]
MTAIIDVIGAMIAGALIMITIIYTIFNVQRNNFNMDMMFNMKTHAQHVVDVLDRAYLENVGAHMATAGPGMDIITAAGPDKFSYRSAKDPYVATVDLFEIRVVGSPNQYQIEVTENGAVIFDSAPFFIANNDIFTYIDFEGNQLDIAANPGAISSIGYCQTNLIFTTFNHDTDVDSMLRYPITFWRGFKNLAIN